MPRDSTINKVLLISSGPIVISQGCEFDYSGTQACKALKEEGCQVVLINPNPATIMTDPELADATYIEPICASVLEKIIKKEKPDAILPTMGGQTALNAVLELSELGILQKYSVRIIGVNVETIKKAENREEFKKVLVTANLDSPHSVTINSLEDLKQINFSFGFPRVVRTSYTLGGSGSGLVNNDKELSDICKTAFEANPNTSILIEEALIGWKEFELEVMADAVGNYIVVCPIENLDPMGIHTGDSITVAPTQTLTDKEYQQMRNAAKSLMQKIGMTSGGCNVQFASNPHTGRIVIIEINPRVSRSSALASKATGFLIARIAAKISLGYTLNELSNDITQGVIPASFEPTIDYVVVKIPRFTFDKFPEANSTLTTQMKSIGEVMGIGSTFQEALQKGIRSLEIGEDGLSFGGLKNQRMLPDNLLREHLVIPNEKRLFYIAEAFYRGWTLEEVHKLTYIDPWFLDQIRQIVTLESGLEVQELKSIDEDKLLFLKRCGFSDKQIANRLKISEKDIYSLRNDYKIRPIYKRIDSCSAEFPSKTSYMYSTYEQICEANPTANKKIVILGSGPNRIGQGIEFDYCCVHAAYAVKQLGYEAIMINSNPETVSTDYDCSDRLYFEPLTLENVREILLLEAPDGIFSQFGGQTSLLLGQDLCKEGFNIIGTSPTSIDKAEDRIEFKRVLDKLGIKQLPNTICNNIEEALLFSNQVGYPLILRVSYVIGGKGFAKINNAKELVRYFKMLPLDGNRIFLEKFIEDAMEIDVDAIYDGKELAICGILEQIEKAGIHSGDSISVFPSRNLSPNIISQIISYSHAIAAEIEVRGFLNLQFIVKDNNLYTLEANPRASRTIPFISKAVGTSFVKVAVRTVLGESLKDQKISLFNKPSLCAIKVPIFSFSKLPGVNKSLGIEMKSTGEAMALGSSFEEAMHKISFFEKHSEKINKQRAINIYALQ